MMLALTAQLWRLQVLGAQNFRIAGRAEPHPQGADSGAARQALRPRKPACGGQLSFGLLLPGARAEPQRGRRSAADRAGPEPRPGSVARHAAPLPRCAGLSAHPHQAGHYRRRAGLYRSASQRTARAGNDRRGTPALSARRLCRAPDRLRGRSERRRSEQSALCLLRAGRCGGQGAAWKRPTTSCCAGRTARAT